MQQVMTGRGALASSQEACPWGEDKIFEVK